MRRAPASIVILAWNAWGETQACLESLRPTLDLHDQVIVVDNGSSDATAARLRLFSWVEVVTNGENRGFAGGCNQGAALARHDIVVFLNNDTVLHGRWLDALLAPFADQHVGATGPRSNFVSGPQIAEGASYAAGDRNAMRRFARTWAEAHRGEISVTERLVGFCLAVRRQTFLAVDGFDEGYEIGGFEDDDLCRRLTDAGWGLVVAHEAFVHHAGHRSFDVNNVDWFAQQEANRIRFESKFGDRSNRDFPLVSACLIVRDEEENLPGCLASLQGLADEIVVYDTGSTDGTVPLARKLGATVIEGYWDDDFSRARNEALAQCGGEWIVWLDADETLSCQDLGELRQYLARTGPEVEGFGIHIDNLTGSGVGAIFVHSACRIFRRANCQWVGRLHEQVASRQGHRPVASIALDQARIRHTGYMTEAMAKRGKAERNVRVAKEEVERSTSWDQGFALTSLGRAYMTAGQSEEALDACRQGAAQTKNPHTRRLALRTAIEALLVLGRIDEADEVLVEFRRASERQVLADLLEAGICRRRGEFERALSLYERVGRAEVDDDRFEYEANMFARHRSELLVELGRFSDAADTLLSVLDEDGILDAHLGLVIEYLNKAGRPLLDLARAIPGEKRQMFLAQVLQLFPDTADQVLEACVVHEAESSEQVSLDLLATAATVAPTLGIERALVWSSRLRTRGLESACPLVTIALDGERLNVERARAAAAGYQLFGDERLASAFSAVAARAGSDLSVILHEAESLCPALAAQVLAGSTDCSNPMSESAIAPPTPTVGPVTEGTAGGPDHGPSASYYGFERPEVVALVPHEAKAILDVGCAAGRLGQAIKKRQSCHVTGIELNPAVAQAAGQVLDRVIVADLNRGLVDLPAESLDCVVCADVLEHLVDPWAVVRSFHAALRPGGTIVTSIPNIRNLGVLAEIASGTFTYQEAGILDRTHLRFFTRATFEQLLHGEGFDVDLCQWVADPALSLDRHRVGEGLHSLNLGRISIGDVTPAEIEEFSAVQILFRARKRRGG